MYNFSAWIIIKKYISTEDAPKVFLIAISVFRCSHMKLDMQKNPSKVIMADVMVKQLKISPIIVSDRNSLLISESVIVYSKGISFSYFSHTLPIYLILSAICRGKNLTDSISVSFPLEFSKLFFGIWKLIKLQFAQFWHTLIVIKLI